MRSILPARRRCCGGCGGSTSTYGAVLVIGHNPGLHELALALAAAELPRGQVLASGKFPTAARASFVIEGPWASLGRSPHALIDYATPKSLAGRD